MGPLGGSLGLCFPKRFRSRSSSDLSLLEAQLAIDWFWRAGLLSRFSCWRILIGWFHIHSGGSVLCSAISAMRWVVAFPDLLVQIKLQYSFPALRSWMSWIIWSISQYCPSPLHACITCRLSYSKTTFSHPRLLAKHTTSLVAMTSARRVEEATDRRKDPWTTSPLEFLAIISTVAFFEWRLNVESVLHFKNPSIGFLYPWSSLLACLCSWLLCFLQFASRNSFWRH